MSTSPTLFNTSSSSGSTRLASPPQKIMETTKPRTKSPVVVTTTKPLSSPNKRLPTKKKKQSEQKATTHTAHKKAPWRVPGSKFEIPDIIKEEWEKKQNQLKQNEKDKEQKKTSSFVIIEHKIKKRWIPVGKSPDILPMPPPILKVKRKLHAEFDAKLRKVLPGSKIMETDPNEEFDSLCQVGSGANGAVVRATKKANKAHVAIKRCYIEDQDIPHHAYILRELRIMGRLEHPNLVHLTEAALWGDHLWMCMELMSCSVFNLLFHTSVGLNEGNTVRVAKECLKGLVYLHSNNYMHRDIKCENILLNRNGQVKLADFGLATPLNRENAARLGTAKWMAPEVVLEEPYKSNVDTWSLGVTMIEMMDRVPPLYYLEDTSDIYAEIIYGGSPKFHFTKPSSSMAGIVQWMLTHNSIVRPYPQAVLKKMYTEIKRGNLRCTKQRDLARLVCQVFPDSLD